MQQSAATQIMRLRQAAEFLNVSPATVRGSSGPGSFRRLR